MPTLTQLEYIVAVDQCRHFGNASEKCHVSQPSLSMQIQKVEDEVGVILFDRSKKPIQTTLKGIVFVEQSKVVLREHRKLVELAKTTKKEVSGDFRLGVIPTIAPYLLPFMIDSFSKTFPKVNLRIDELRTENIISQLREDSLDAGILATPLHEKGILESILYYEKFSLYLSQNHPLSKKRKIKESDLNANEIWLLQDGHCLRNQIIKICSLNSEKSVYRNIKFEGSSLETLRNIVQKNKGYTLMPQLFVNALPLAERKSCVRDFESPRPNREISLVYRRDQWKAEVLGAIERTVKQNIPEEVKQNFDEKNNRIIDAVARRSNVLFQSRT